jgi:Protein of unknown function (DUF3160)
MRASVFFLTALVALACAEPPHLPPRLPATPPPDAASPPAAADATAACEELRDMEATEKNLAEAEAEAPATPDDGSSFRESRVSHGANRCSVADDNIQSLEDAILNGPLPKAIPPSARSAKGAPPQYLDRIDRRFLLEPSERAMLASNGFVVPARLTSPSYGAAFHDVFQSELPIFVTSDAILHAVYAGNDKVLARLETSVLEPSLRRAMAEMTCFLPTVVADYPREVAHDVDVYVSVASALLDGRDPPLPTALGNGVEVEAIVSALREPHGLLGAPDDTPFVLFGRPRVVDTSAYVPRGHYATSLANYFRASTWLSRLELNLVSRSCKSSHPSQRPDPSETPREDVVALALADLAERSGALPLFAKIDRAVSLLAGRREDLSLTDLVALRKTAGITSLTDPDAAAKLRVAIGSGWKRTARTHFTPDGTTELPAIATILGARIGPDTAPTKRLVHDTVPTRFMLHAADMAYVLGNDRAKAWLSKDLSEFPSLASQLDLARSDAKAALVGEDLYSLWWKSIASLASAPKGTVPSFMASTAWEDVRLDSTITAFGQLRHNYVLMAAGTYDSFGCEIPDGYVEPAPEMLEGLVAYAERGSVAAKALDPKDTSLAVHYFGRLEKVLLTLRRIVGRELAGEPLRDAEKRFLGMVAEFAEDYRCFDSCAPPTYTGWWYDLFIDRIADGTATAEFIADYYASTNLGKVAYIGAKAPRLGIFMVDTNGPPRAMVGPIAHGYEHVGGLDARLTDSEAHDVTDLVEPWAASYTVPAPAEPPLRVVEVVPTRKGPPSAPEFFSSAPSRRKGAITLRAESSQNLGPVTLDLLDHHRRSIASVTHPVAAGPVSFVFPEASIRGGPLEVAGVRARVGASSFVSSDSIELSLGRTP